MPICPKPTRGFICVSVAVRLLSPMRPVRRTDLFSSMPVSQPFVSVTRGLTLAWHRPRDITMMRHLARHIDIAFGDSGIRRSIVSELYKLFPGVYNDRNVAIVSTHQHAGVGGYT